MSDQIVLLVALLTPTVLILLLVLAHVVVTSWVPARRERRAVREYQAALDAGAPVSRLYELANRDR